MGSGHLGRSLKPLPCGENNRARRRDNNATENAFSSSAPIWARSLSRPRRDGSIPPRPSASPVPSCLPAAPGWLIPSFSASSALGVYPGRAGTVTIVVAPALPPRMLKNHLRPSAPGVYPGRAGMVHSPRPSAVICAICGSSRWCPPQPFVNRCNLCNLWTTPSRGPQAALSSPISRLPLCSGTPCNRPAPQSPGGL